MMLNFQHQQREAQIEWRKSHISSQKFGKQNAVSCAHIVPKALWKETLWEGIRTELTYYLNANIESHTGTHNLLSSWVACANLYFITKINPDFKKLMLGFLQQHVSTRITSVVDVELEYALDGMLSPESLLGERGGKRGSGQTSPDVAFIATTDKGKGIVLTECKYTEHSFYPCSARRITESEGKSANPDPNRCRHAAINYDYKSICHQTVWGRKYWDHLTLSSNAASILNNCPAATASYQLFRQQSLAEGIAVKGDFDLVVSSAAFDARNDRLIKCMLSTGIDDFTTGWTDLFVGKTIFKTWTHQQWVDYVRANGSGDVQKDWLTYIKERYGY